MLLLHIACHLFIAFPSNHSRHLWIRVIRDCWDLVQVCNLILNVVITSSSNYTTISIFLAQKVSAAISPKLCCQEREKQKILSKKVQESNRFPSSARFKLLCQHCYRLWIQKECSFQFCYCEIIKLHKIFIAFPNSVLLSPSPRCDRCLFPSEKCIYFRAFRRFFFAG